MQKKRKLYSIFVFFTTVSLVIIFLSQRNVLPVVKSVTEQIFVPLQTFAFKSIMGFSVPNESEEMKKLREQNNAFRKAVVDQKELQKEVEALRDQYQSTEIATNTLLPASIIGMQFSPGGNTQPTTMIIDRGRVHGVKVGTVVVYENNLVGSVGSVSERTARVDLIINRRISFSATTTKTGALGVIRGGEVGILFDSVVLSDKLEINDIVVTKGSVNEAGLGYPPGLVVGTIIGISKRASALFQAAEIKSPISVTQLSTVFLMTNNE